MSGGPVRRLRGRWVFPVEGEPIQGGLITVDGERIASVEPAGVAPDALDLGNVAIVPGFVNAHTHLDLPALALPAAPVDQVDWLRRLIALRRGAPAEATREVVEQNLAASLAAGTTMLADVSAGGESWGAVERSGVRGTVFCELVGLKRSRALETSERAFAWLRRARKRATRCGERLRPGLSPHAPYSTVGWLYERAATAGVPLSTHLAELPEELELLRARTGRLRALLEEVEAWDDDWAPLGARPADYVRRGALRNADWLIAHGTYLDETDFWQLRPEAAPARQRVAVAYCPRSNAYFGHGAHPFREMLARGAVVCLGTDSLASAPSLSLLDEMRFLRQNDPELPGNLLLTMATLSGAWALRREGESGSLLPGKFADLCLISLPDAVAVDPHDLLLHTQARVLATMVGGMMVHGPWSG